MAGVHRPGTPIPSPDARHIRVDVPDLLRALYAPAPPGLDGGFCSPLDPPGDFYPAYERATLHYLNLGNAHVAAIWERALNIGFYAGRYLAMKDAHKEGSLEGFEKGRADGLSEGKRLGFVAGRGFGEKHAAKMSKNSSSRVLVDAGTDSPAAELPSPPSTLVNASMQIDTPCITMLPSNPPLNWADEPYDVHAPNQTRSPLLPPRDLSAFRSESTSLTPFATLRYRAHRTQKSPRTSHSSAMRTKFSRRQTAAHAPVPRPLTASSTPKPFTANTTSFLDWDRDPRLSDLSRALRSLGWARDVGHR